MERKLYRNRKNQMIAGVCGGLAAYLDIDPTVIRALFAILAVFGGGGVLLYIILMIVIPLAPETAMLPAEMGSASPSAEPAAPQLTAAEIEATPEPQALVEAEGAAHPVEKPDIQA